MGKVGVNFDRAISDTICTSDEYIGSVNKLSRYKN